MPHRIPLVAVAFMLLVLGVLAGLARMGWNTAVIRTDLASLHGILMVAGFLGTLISLERATAMNKLWAYLAPVCTAIGTVVLLVTLYQGSLIAQVAGALLVVVGSSVLSLILGIFFCRQPALYSVTLFLGAVVLVIAGVLFFLGLSSGDPVSKVVPWWEVFLVLTIAGERLELSRLRKLSLIAQLLFLAVAIFILAGLFFGTQLFGVALIGFSIWLTRYDVASRTLFQKGLPRYIAICLFSGYFWLGIGGVFTYLFGEFTAGVYYDATLHSIFLGFVFAMIFGHAPVILPAVTGLAVPFRQRFYAHFAVLQFSLILRMIGDFSGSLEIRQWGGLLNAIAIVVFFGNTLSAVVSEKIRASRSRAA